MTSKLARTLPAAINLRRLMVTLALATIALPALSAMSVDPDSREQLVDLANRHWRFSVGDDATWAEPGFDDQHWSRIEVPGPWQDDGYDGYHGYAWYRYTFTFSDKADQPTILLLGQIDDVDEVYVNGHKVGGIGQFPPNYASAWNRDRTYPVPAGTLKEGRDNVIAVRVFDGGGEGGIKGRAIGLYTTHLPRPAIDLTGEWQFHPGDNLAWKEVHADESGFVPMTVPGYWENAGYENLDGFAWYRKSFQYTPPADDKTMVLMLGKIDDTDEVYLNGTKIGSTGTLRDSDRNSGVDYYAENRGYYFATSLLKDKNVIAVRVHDHGGMGGIYEGPIGIIRQADYIAYWETVRRDHPHSRTLRSLLRVLSGN